MYPSSDLVIKKSFLSFEISFDSHVVDSFSYEVSVMNKLKTIQFNIVPKHKIKHFISNVPHLIKHVFATSDNVMHNNLSLDN